MADQEQVARLLEGVAAWNAWREKNPRTLIDLSEANLEGAKLDRATLRANLSWANLSGATLRGASLGRADLRGATLRVADLRGASLSEAFLNGTSLIGANLSGASFSRTHLDETLFCDVNLSTAVGLDTCIHWGPSTIDHRTLAQSDPLPLAFMRGCGLPDKLIHYLPSLFNQPIQFYSCFISYSTKDQDFADRLYADLQNKGVRCWFAPHDVAGGKKLHEQIDEAIRVYDRLLLVLSDHSIKSPWVETEISKARKREKRESRRMLFPVRLVSFEALQEWQCFDDTGEDLARVIRKYFIPDFSNWKDHDRYQAEFQRLLKDLTTKGDLKEKA